MDRHGIAIVLEEIATLLDLQGANRFKVRAFANAARAIERADAADLEADRLESLEGIGPATAAVVRELSATGVSSYYAELRERTPSGLLDLLAIPRLGPSKIRLLHEELGVASLDDLERAAREGRVARLAGFGPRTQDTILEGIGHVRRSSGRRRYVDALELGERLHAFIAGLPGAARASLAGELRRGCETVPDARLVTEADQDALDDVRAALARLPGLMPGDDASVVEGTLADGFDVHIRLAGRAAYATTLLLETGSAAHVDALRACASEAGLELRADGLFRAGERLDATDEADVYRALGLDPVPPELREDGVAEVDAARAGTLPDLVTYESLQGCFHCHTTWSDGKATVAEMAEAAEARGWRYLGIADHSQFAGYAGGLSPEEILEQHDEIDAWNDAHGDRVWLFKGMEADILSDGTLDYADRPDLLERFDYIVASAHSSLQQSEDDQTRRFLRVMENPYVTFLGHLTGRLLLSRPGMHIDIPTVLAAAAELGVSIEINGDPNRLDMDWRHWPAAKALGIRTAINPDAHSTSQLEYVRWGVTMARKGWLEPNDVVNCGSLEDVRRFLSLPRAERFR